MTVHGSNLPTMQMHIEGTPALVEEARKQLTALGGTVVDATVHYKGSGYTAIETDLEDGVNELTRRIEDPHYVSGGKVRLLCGYVGPMTINAEVEAGHAQNFIDLLAKTGAIVDNVKLDGHRCTFRTNADGKAIARTAAILDCRAHANNQVSRFGYR